MKKKFTTTFSEETIKQMKMASIQENTSVSELLEKIFKEYQSKKTQKQNL